MKENVLEIMAEITRSLAERYDKEFERLGGDRGHIHLLHPADPKIVPWQFVRMFKRVTDREGFRGKLALKKELWAGSFGRMAIMGGQWGREEIGGLSNSMCRC